MRVSVEVCATSLAEVQAAEEAGCDAVELTTWLACGGVTPSLGTIRTVTEQTRIPVRVLVRPGPGDFRLKGSERSILTNDISILCATSGVHGAVTGGLDEDLRPDTRLMKEVLDQCARHGKELTFHRAIDMCRDLNEAVERCLRLGIPRILTSGGATTAVQGCERIRGMVELANGAARIVAAAGVNGTNVVELVERTGVSEVHFSATRSMGGPAATMPFDTGRRFEPDRSRIHGVLNALVKAGLR